MPPYACCAAPTSSLPGTHTAPKRFFINPYSPSCDIIHRKSMYNTCSIPGLQHHHQQRLPSLRLAKLAIYLGDFSHTPCSHYAHDSVYFRINCRTPTRRKALCRAISNQINALLFLISSFKNILSPKNTNQNFTLPISGCDSPYLTFTLPVSAFPFRTFLPPSCCTYFPIPCACLFSSCHCGRCNLFQARRCRWRR